MKNLINAHIYLLKCNIDKKKVLLVKVAAVLVLALTFVVGVTFLCSINYNVVKIFMDKYSLLLMTYIVITVIPLSIYSKFIVNKEFDMLFMAPVSLKSCYIWIYMKQALIMMLVLAGAYISMIPSCIQMNYHLSNHFATMVSILVSAYNITIILEMVIYRFLGANIYKIILVFIGCFEIISFFILQALIDGNLVVNFTINSIGNNKVTTVIINIALVYVSYRLFVEIYNNKGFSSQKVITKNKKHKELLDLKEYKLFIRDFDRIKYAVVTLFIYISTTVVGANKVDCLTLYVINVSFLVVIAFQLTIDCISVDKDKKDVFILSNVSWGKYIVEKVNFIMIVTGGFCVILDVAIFFYHKIMIKNIIVFVFGTIYLLVLIPFIYCDKIGQVKLDEKADTIKKKIINYCKKILIIGFDVLVICSLAIVVMLIQSEWYIKVIIYFLMSALGYWKIQRRTNVMRKITFEQVARGQ